jgi:sulfate transport system ATP-binding protein
VAAATAVAYVRPHDLIVERVPNGAATLPAVVRHISVVGPVARLELERSDAEQPLSVELTRDIFDALALAPGDEVHVRPRTARVFPG